ncbi:MAG: FecR family protein, partial [Nevskiales bacterium]
LPIAKGTPFEAGDTIATGADGRVQLLMADGDRIALRPNSRFSIDEFSGPSRAKPGQPVPDTRPSSWKSFYTLAKGGFRTLTASLGQRDASSYQVRTPVATIGIRGTDYTLLYCPESCDVYQIASAVTPNKGVRVEGMQASVFRESAGSRLLFAALGTSWVQEFLKAQQVGAGGGSGGTSGQLFGGVSKGEIEVKDPSGAINSVKDNEFFKADDGGFNKLPEPPQGLSDSSENEDEGNYQEQVSGEGEGTTEGESTAEGESTTEPESENFSARTDPIEGDGSGDGGTTTEDGSVGDLTIEFGTADTGTTDPADAPVQDITATDPSGNPVDLTGGNTTPDRSGAFAHGPDGVSDFVLGSGIVPSSTVLLNSNGEVLGFTADLEDALQQPFTALYNIGSAQNVEDPLAGDFDLGLRWGRWTGGMAQVTVNGVIKDLDLTMQSLHWIYGPEFDSPPVIPMSGTYAYTFLAGETDPTDNHGNVGFLGFADFSADFLNQTVDSTIGLSVNDQAWDASGSGSIGSGGTFFGNYGCTGAGCTSMGSVTVTDSGSCAGGCAGTGDFSGFFTPGGSSSIPPPGAGMTYSLNDGSGTTVSGAAAFGDPQGPQ